MPDNIMGFYSSRFVKSILSWGYLGFRCIIRNKRGEECNKVIAAGSLDEHLWTDHRDEYYELVKLREQKDPAKLVLEGYQ